MIDTFIKGLTKPFDNNTTVSNGDSLAAYAIVLAVFSVIRS